MVIELWLSHLLIGLANEDRRLLPGLFRNIRYSCCLIWPVCVCFLVDCKSDTTALLHNSLPQQCTLLPNAGGENQSINMTVQLDNIAANEACDTVYKYVEG